VSWAGGCQLGSCFPFLALVSAPFVWIVLGCYLLRGGVVVCVWEGRGERRRGCVCGFMS
jgi:hypothetical protein